MTRNSRTIGSASTDGSLRAWELDWSGRDQNVFRGHTDLVETIAFAPDGRVLASGGKDQTVRLWDVAKTGSPEQALLKGHTNAVTSVVFAPDGKTLASAGKDGRVVLWPAAGGGKLREWQLPGEVHGLAFAPDGRHLAIAAANGTVYLLRLAAPARAGS